MSASHPLIKDGWFTEKSDQYFPGQAFQLRVEEILYSGRSKFQDVLLFKSTDFGNVLVLDGVIQVTERDEFAYQEMISHVPLFAHPNPKRVLIIGGGDGGVLREVVKHKCVEKAVQVEIDETVIEISKKYLPNMSCSYNDPKAEVIITDGFQFLKDSALETSQKWDVIITDSSDPDGPAEAFFQKDYFSLLDNALNDNGIVISMASENVWLNVNNLGNLRKVCKSVFKNVQCCYCTIPSYTSGQICLMVCAKNNVITKSSRNVDIEGLKYYNEKIHEASFVLPAWADAIINKD
ncbi:spermine synthase [Martiniozyma asiatica (nom. inval.)]|nr:spermine synthase [Martiniozyma asiatica]